MKITKYEHACFTVERDGALVVVDPGGYTTDFIAPENVSAIIITHTHADHFDHDQIAAIMDKNPNARIIAHPEITQHIEVFETQNTLPGDHIVVGPFTFAFFGGEHAIIHPSIPPVTNLGLLINDLLYYPGDSLTRPGVPVDTLALPVGAPWLKLGDAIDFAIDIAPRFIFPTHDAVLSAAGKQLADTMVPQLVTGSEYRRIDGTSIEI